MRLLCSIRSFSVVDLSIRDFFVDEMQVDISKHFVEFLICIGSKLYCMKSSLEHATQRVTRNTQR